MPGVTSLEASSAPARRNGIARIRWCVMDVPHLHHAANGGRLSAEGTSRRRFSYSLHEVHGQLALSHDLLGGFDGGLRCHYSLRLRRSEERGGGKEGRY